MTTGGRPAGAEGPACLARETSRAAHWVVEKARGPLLEGHEWTTLEFEVIKWMRDVCRVERDKFGYARHVFSGDIIHISFEEEIGPEAAAGLLAIGYVVVWDGGAAGRMRGGPVESIEI